MAKKLNRKVYKITHMDMSARHGFQYHLNQEAYATGKGMELCSDGVLHSYRHPLLATVFRFIHAVDYTNLRIFEAEALGRINEPTQIKLGSKGLKLLKEVKMPVITEEFKLRVIALIGLELSSVKRFRKVMEGYLKRGKIGKRALKELETYMNKRAKKRKYGEFEHESYTIGRLKSFAPSNTYFAEHVEEFLSGLPNKGNDFDLIGLLEKADI